MQSDKSQPYGMPVKRMKVDDYTADIEVNEDKENGFRKPTKQQMMGCQGHISDLSLEEGAILIENWKKTNFSEFNIWLENACAQATFQIEEKLSMDNKSKKSKPVQIKSFQCHLHLKFMDGNLETLIANGFGRNKKDARKMAIQQMVTFLVQKKLIKFGLRDKSFLENKVNSKSFAKDRIESKLLDPEEEKKNKELKNILESIQNNLNEDKFDEACLNFSKIRQLKSYEWFEVCGLWTYIVKKRNTRYVKIILDLISRNNSKNIEDSSTNSHHIARTKNKLYNIYGHSRMRSVNPYELYDHKSVNNELIMANCPQPDPMSSLGHLPAEINMKPYDLDTFKGILSQYYQGDVNSRLNYSSIPEPMAEESVYDLDICSYKPLLDKNGIRELKNQEFNYINHSLLVDMYDLLMYSGDLKFSSIAAEIIYSTARLDDNNFVNWCASHYFSNRRNQVFHEMLETNYTKFPDGTDFTRIEGRIEIVGKKSKQEVVMFSPKDAEDFLATKIHKKNSYSPGYTGTMFKEGEFILLMSRKNVMSKIQENLFDEGQFMDKADQTMRRYQTTLELVGRNYDLLKRMGFPAQGEMTCVMALVSEISPNYKLKLYVLFEEQHYRYLEFGDQPWYIVRSNSHFVPNYMRICDGLRQFCTKISMNPSIQQVLLSTPLINFNYLNKLVRSSAITLNSTNNEVIKNIVGSLEEKMNLQQIEAVKSSLYSNMTLIQAPAGTNKMLTIYEIVKAWVNYAGSQVLVYSKSKAAVDAIHLTLLKMNTSSLCLNDDAANDESIYDDSAKTVNWLCQNNFTLNPLNVRFENFKTVAEQFKVICCSSSEILSENLKNFIFTRVLVDDAAQITELELIPALIKNCQQVVLVGDDKQIPPVSLSVMAKSKGINVTTFEKLVKQKIKPILFSAQYTFHSSLYTFPSYRFYNGLISSGSKDSQNTLPRGIDWPNKAVHAVFVNSQSGEDLVGGSVANVREAEVVCRLLAKLIASKDILPEEVCVLTAYHAQKARLRQEISQINSKCAGHFEESTIETLIGSVALLEDSLDSEKELTLFSAVRSNSKLNELDVLSDFRTLNTLLTRGRRGLVVVGDLQTLIADDNWREWLIWAMASGIVATL